MRHLRTGRGSLITVNNLHDYAISLEWTGNRGTGTDHYRSYGRDHTVRAAGKHDISGSSDRVFHGDVDRWNPEEMLLSALSQCHLLSYLHVAASHGVIVVSYTDSAIATLETMDDGSGHIVSVTLRPVVTIAGENAELALAAHHEASTKCFIAASMNFAVVHEPTIRTL